MLHDMTKASKVLLKALSWPVPNLQGHFTGQIQRRRKDIQITHSYFSSVSPRGRADQVAGLTMLVQQFSEFIFLAIYSLIGPFMQNDSGFLVFTDYGNTLLAVVFW